MRMAVSVQIYNFAALLRVGQRVMVLLAIAANQLLQQLYRGMLRPRPKVRGGFVNRPWPGGFALR